MHSNFLLLTALILSNFLLTATEVIFFRRYCYCHLRTLHVVWPKKFAKYSRKIREKFAKYSRKIREKFTKNLRKNRKKIAKNQNLLIFHDFFTNFSRILIFCDFFAIFSQIFRKFFAYFSRIFRKFFAYFSRIFREFFGPDHVKSP